MRGNINQIQRGKDINVKKDIKEAKTTTNTTVIKTVIKKPNTRKVEEKKIVIEKEALPKNINGKMPQAPGKSNGFYSIKRNNDLTIKTKINDNSYNNKNTFITQKVSSGKPLQRTTKNADMSK